MRLGDVSAYNESLHQRYPFVCERCEPLVREEIEKKDHMARVQALGGSLSKGRARRRGIPGSFDKAQVKPKVVKLVWWRIRGVLWALAFIVSILGTSTGLYPEFCFLRLLMSVTSDSWSVSAVEIRIPQSAITTRCSDIPLLGNVGLHLRSLSNGPDTRPRCASPLQEPLPCMSCPLNHEKPTDSFVRLFI